MIDDRWNYMSEKCSFARKFQMTTNDKGNYKLKIIDDKWDFKF